MITKREYMPWEIPYLHPETDGDVYYEVLEACESKSKEEWLEFYESCMQVDGIRDDILDEVDEYFDLKGTDEDVVPDDWYIMCAQLQYLYNHSIVL